jgi:hypothetical protein
MFGVEKCVPLREYNHPFTGLCALLGRKKIARSLSFMAVINKERLQALETSTH